jgi:hypothetical protein
MVWAWSLGFPFIPPLMGGAGLGCIDRSLTMNFRTEWKVCPIAAKEYILVEISAILLMVGLIENKRGAFSGLNPDGNFSNLFVTTVAKAAA